MQVRNTYTQITIPMSSKWHRQQKTTKFPNYTLTRYLVKNKNSLNVKIPNHNLHADTDRSKRYVSKENDLTQCY